MNILKNLKLKIRIAVYGRLKCAVKDGMKTGTNCSCMGGVNFGSEPYLIKLGDNVRISSNVCFVNHDGGSWIHRREGKYKDVVRFDKIEVGNNVFIGLNSIIMPGVVIGNNVVIGAGSVVTKRIPDNEVWAGNPAHFICSVEDYAEKMKNRMTTNWNTEELEKNKKDYLIKTIK